MSKDDRLVVGLCILSFIGAVLLIWKAVTFITSVL
jgi:hypothetical protein